MCGRIEHDDNNGIQQYKLNNPPGKWKYPFTLVVVITSRQGGTLWRCGMKEYILNKKLDGWTTAEDIPPNLSSFLQHEIMTIPLSDNPEYPYRFGFGLRKARAIVKYYEYIKEWVDKNKDTPISEDHKSSKPYSRPFYFIEDDCG